MNKKNTFLFLAGCSIILLIIFTINILIKKDTNTLSLISQGPRQPQMSENMQVQEQRKYKTEEEPRQEPAVLPGEPLLF